jgi:GDPmannose 4,6-dehydratase
MPTAFITGVTGQDGSYLTELLLEQGYTVHGLVHRPEGLATGNLRHLVNDPALLGRRLFLHAGSFEDTTHLRRLMLKARPDEFYHLAGGTTPRMSLELPEAAVETVGMATLRLLEILRDFPEPPRFLFASSSEVFGSCERGPQDENTPMDPNTPYGAAKAMAQQLARIYRVAYGLPTCSAILYNHESPRRLDTFVTMKIARGAARIRDGLQTRLQLGRLDGRRDWGWAPDYVRGMWLMLQRRELDDFVLATGELHSVREIVETAFEHVGLDWRRHVDHDPSLDQPVERVQPYGNPARARSLLGWSNTVPFHDIVRRMVDAHRAHA